MTDRRPGLFLLFAVCLAAIGIGLALAWNSQQHSMDTPVALVAATPTPTTPTPANPTSATPRPATPTSGTGCHSLNGLPDPTCTPGVADPRVTQDNIHSTICVSGYTTTVRPPSSYTDSLKRQQVRAYGYSDTRLADYEEDHLIPLELGGHPTDAKNLWPEPRAGDFPAAMKDALENSLHSRVCAGLMTLAAAQAAIATNWESAQAVSSA